MTKTKPRTKSQLHCLAAVACIFICGFVAASPAAETAARKAGWDFAFKDFPIGAFSPPSDTDAEYAMYKAAGFNAVMSPRYALPDKSLELAAKHKLMVMIDT